MSSTSFPKPHTRKPHPTTPIIKTQHQLHLTPHARIISKLPKSTNLPTINLSSSSLKSISTALSSSWATSTKNNYKRIIQRFGEFCDREKVPDSLRTPTPEILLCAFAADGIGNFSGSTASGKIAALKAWHISNNWPWLGSSRLYQIIHGFKNMAPKDSTRPRKQHVTLQALEKLFLHLNQRDPLDLTILTCASIAFWGQCRLGELLATSSTDLSTSLYPARSAIRKSQQNRDAWILRLPTTKTSRRGQDIILLRQSNHLSNPIQILSTFLQSTFKSIPNSAPIFAYRHNNKIIMLTKKTFLERCNQIWSRTGHIKCTGHSFRIGGTTHLLISEVSPTIVKMMGRWSSDAFLKYWRSVEDIATLHASNLTFTDTLKSTTRKPLLINATTN